jgi:hypothetical protein
MDLAITVKCSLNATDCVLEPVQYTESDAIVLPERGTLKVEPFLLWN